MDPSTLWSNDCWCYSLDTWPWTLYCRWWWNREMSLSIYLFSPYAKTCLFFMNSNRFVYTCTVTLFQRFDLLKGMSVSCNETHQLFYFSNIPEDIVYLDMMYGRLCVIWSTAVPTNDETIINNGVTVMQDGNNSSYSSLCCVRYINQSGIWRQCVLPIMERFIPG